MRRLDGTLADIQDLMKDRKQTLLTAKLIGFKEERLNKLLQKLIDFVNPREQRYTKRLTATEIKELAPLYAGRLKGGKAGAARLLNRINDKVKRMPIEDERRYLKGQKGAPFKPEGYDPPKFKSDSQARITPLQRHEYRDFFGTIYLKRFPREARMQYECDICEIGWYSARLQAVVSQGKIRFMHRKGEVTPLDWRKYERD